jgi:hypothetical protein
MGVPNHSFVATCLEKEENEQADSVLIREVAGAVYIGWCYCSQLLYYITYSKEPGSGIRNNSIVAPDALFGYVNTPNCSEETSI